MKRERIINWCDKIVAFSYYALIYFLPISTALCESFAGATLFFFFVKRGCMFSINLKKVPLKEEKSSIKKIINVLAIFLRSFKPQKSYLSYPIGTFILVCALSIIRSQYLMYSLSGFFFKVLQWTFLYFVFIEFIKTKRQLRIFITIFLISITVVSANGVVQYMAGKGFMFGHVLMEGRVNSSLRHANDFGAYLIFACALLLSLLINYSLFPKKTAENSSGIRPIFKRPITIVICLLVIFSLAAVSLGFTYSRGAWLGFFVALFFIGWQKKKNFLIGSLVILLFMSVFYPRLVKTRNASLFSEEVHVHGARRKEKLFSQFQKDNFTKEKILETLNEFAGSGRSSRWREAMIIIGDSPILGSGINTYSQVASNYKVKFGWGGYPHNCYLQMAAEIGLVGLGVFMWIILAFFRNSIKNLRLIKDKYLYAVSLGLLAGLLGFLIHSFVDTNFYSVQLANLMWVVMGAVVVAQKIGLKQDTGE